MRKPAGRRSPETKPKKARKSVRIELRLTPASKKVIERAVAITGLTPGDLAYDAARRLLEENERFVLRDADREVFFEALRNPPEPTPALIRAVKRYRALTR